MEFKDFKIVRNRQRPEFCYSYVNYNSDKTQKCVIYTIDGSVTFGASVTVIDNFGKLTRNVFSGLYNSKEDALSSMNIFLNDVNNPFRK